MPDWEPHWTTLLDSDPHKAVLCPTGIYDQFCSVFRDVTQIFEASPGAVLLQLRPFPDFACEQVETTLMPAADQAKISSDRALRVWELQCFGLSGASAFVKRQMKMRACIIEGTIGVGSANDDDIVILQNRESGVRRAEARLRQKRGSTSCRPDEWFREAPWHSARRRFRASA